MKLLLFYLLLFINTNPVQLAKINKLKNEARYAYLNKNFKEAIMNYHLLVDSMDIKEDEIFINLAHSYYQINDTIMSKKYYEKVTTSPNLELKSVAYQQIGVLNKRSQKYDESLANFKTSLKANPKNTDARYNYELLKKILKEQQQNQDKNKDQDKDQENKDKNKDQDKNKEGENQDKQDQQNKDQENKDKNKDQDKNKEGENQDKQNQNQENKDKQDQENKEKDNKGKEGEKKNEGEKDQQQSQQEEKEKREKEQKEETLKKLQEMNISEQKAKMILEAMKNSEIQYLQQQKRKASKRPSSGKPDW